MEQAIKAYRQITVTEEFRELERTRREAEINRASALGNARREERKKWQGIVEGKDALIAKLQAQLSERETELDLT